MALRDVTEMERRARLAYETGRMRAGLYRAWPALALAGSALLWCHDLRLCLLCGLILYASAAGLLWRGQGWGRAVGPALRAGVAPAVSPLLGQVLESSVTVISCSTSCALVCIVCGIIGGGLFGYRAARLETDRLAYLASGGIILSLAGSLGCLQMGTLGMMGMLAGFALGGLPVLVYGSFVRA